MIQISTSLPPVKEMTEKQSPPALFEASCQSRVRGDKALSSSPRKGRLLCQLSSALELTVPTW